MNVLQSTYDEVAIENSGLRAEIERLRAALKPFADFCPKGLLDDAIPDEFIITKGSGMAKRQLNIGDLRAARRALEQKAPADHGQQARKDSDPR